MYTPIQDPMLTVKTMATAKCSSPH